MAAKSLKGRLRNKITIQQPTETLDSYGDLTTSWSTYAVCWAAVVPLNGTEYYQARQADAFVTTRITTRYIDGITNKMRVLWGSRVYNIESVINRMEMDRELVLMCKEDVA